MPHLSGSEAVEQRDSELFFPLAMQLDRQSLSRRCRQPNAGEVGDLFFGAQQVVHHRRDVDEDGRLELLDAAEEGLGRAALRKQGGGRTGIERKKEIASSRVPEEKFGYRERDVVFRQAERPLSVELGRIQERPM